MSALPEGALSALTSEGPEAFDRVIAEDRAATEAALTGEPVVAKNDYNQSKQAAPAQSTHEMKAIREAHILKGMREHPGRTRAEIEAAFAREAAAAKAKAKGAAPPPRLEAPAMDLTETDTATLVKMAGIAPGPVPSNLAFSDEHLGQFATYVIEQNIPSRTASELTAWWLDRVVEGAGEGDLAALEKRFAEDFKGKLSDAQRSLLARWMKETVLGLGE